MKNLKRLTPFLSSFVLIVLCSSYFAVGNDERKTILNDGVYVGNSTCTCCGKYANKPMNDYKITVKNISENKISFYYLQYQNREVIGNIVDGKIIIDERNNGLKSIQFWGTIEVLDENTMKIDVEWRDSGSPYPDEILNHCIGTHKKI